MQEFALCVCENNSQSINFLLSWVAVSMSLIITSFNGDFFLCAKCQLSISYYWFSTSPTPLASTVDRQQHNDSQLWWFFCFVFSTLSDGYVKFVIVIHSLFPSHHRWSFCHSTPSTHSTYNSKYSLMKIGSAQKNFTLLLPLEPYPFVSHHIIIAAARWVTSKHRSNRTTNRWNIYFESMTTAHWNAPHIALPFPFIMIHVRHELVNFYDKKSFSLFAMA